MPLYFYRVIDQNGKIDRGYHRAATLKKLSDQMAVDNKTLIQCRLYRPLMVWSFCCGGVGLSDLSEFFGYLALFEKSGVGLESSLETLMETFDKPVVKQMITDFLDGLDQGKTLSMTVKTGLYPYQELIGGLLKAGEEKGTIGPYCSQIQICLNDRLDFEKKRQKAIIYPAFVFTVTAFLMGILIVYLVPQFQQFMTGQVLGVGSQPLAMRILFAVSRNPMGILYGLMGFPLAIFVGVRVGCAISVDFCKRFQGFMSRIPLVRLYDHLSISLCFSVIGGLLESGLGLMPALDIGGQILCKQSLRGHYADFMAGVKTGVSISGALKKWPGLPHTFWRLVQAGEESGTLGAAFVAGADHLKQKSDSGIDTYLNLLQPILLMVVGGFLAWIAAAFFLPLYDHIAVLEGGI